MFDFILAFRLFLSIFSFDRKSPRFPYPKRIASVIFILPGLVVLIIVNRFFMMLDWVFFPGFLRKKINQSVFIVGTPRSATTFLYGILASDEKHFTASKLWEIVFAPSILQKYLFRFLIAIDRGIGKPFYRLSRFSERIFFSRMKNIHELSWSNPEEDEMLLSYSMSSVMLIFFFPGAKALDPLLYFDEEIPEKKRKRIMLFYKRCVQRHLFVFDRKNEKHYLSKNPCFICKTASIAETFPGSRLVYTLRSPYKTIPSTISLNANLYSFFAKKSESPLAEETRDTVIRWYKMADKSIRENWNDRHFIVPFKKITREPEKSLQELYRFLKLDVSAQMNTVFLAEEEKSRNYCSGHQYNEKAGVNDSVITSELDFILDGKYADQI